MLYSILCRSIILFGLLNSVNASIDDPIKICAIRISFDEDDIASTTGNGKFLLEDQGIDCKSYTIDSTPHDKSYFQSQLIALDSYFRSVSYGNFGIDLEGSNIYPSGQDDSYQLARKMNYYNPYNENESQELRLTELFKDALEGAYEQDQVNYSDYDLVVVFHAGIGQDFSLPFLDPTPEDIPSTYVDQKMIEDNFNESGIMIGGHFIQHGILLPESQNHLLFDISESMFSDAAEPCEYQYGLTGTFALMVGFAVGLPPLWNVESGESRIGVFGLMDQGSNNGRGLIPAPPTAWSRIHAGWEMPYSPGYNTDIQLPTRSEGNIIKIPIRDDEYYLIENRSNDVREGVSIDSIRYLMGQTSGNGTYPAYTEILQDSSGIEKDENGVVVSVPNYDIALPASGLLIWHIDENMISSSIDGYGINDDISSMGVDLEEADGAQDIGHPSIFLFNDPSGGYFGDMWFKGNTQYVLANPSLEGLKPEFGPDTYPSTKANDGSSTYIQIEEIGVARDTMRFSLTNSIIADGYPQQDANILALYDIDRDGYNDVFGGLDSVYVCKVDSSILRENFHPLSSSDIFISFIEKDGHTILDIVENFQDSSLHSVYHYYLSSQTITSQGQEWSDSLFYPVVDKETQTIEMKTEPQWDIHSKRVFTDAHSYGIDIGASGISVDRFGDSEKKWETRHFRYISGIDLDLDASTDVMAIDSAGILYGFNSDLILMAGFPLDQKVVPPVLSKDLFGDEYPEIIVRSADLGSLFIFNSRGIINHEIAIDGDDGLIALGEHRGKNSVYTSSAIYQFDGVSDNEYKGNVWTSFHGDGNTRSIDLDYDFATNSGPIMLRSYCYPNPIREGQGVLRVESNGGEEAKIMIYDLAGYFIHSFTSDIQGPGNQISEWAWDVRGLAPGVYFAHVNISGTDKMESSVIKIAVMD